MVKGLSALLLAACLLLAPAPLISCSATPVAMSHLVDGPSDMDLVFSQVALPTYKVLAKDGEAEWSGSAVAIDRFTLVTAAHVVTDMANSALTEPVVIFSKIGKKYIGHARVKALMVRSDLAILKTDAELPHFAQVPLEPELPTLVRWGERVWVSGHALGVDSPIVTDGRINDLADESPSGASWIRYTAPQIYGNSGGPVYCFDGRSFKLVSIAQAGYVSGMSMVTHMSLGCNSYTLLRFIRENV